MLSTTNMALIFGAGSTSVSSPLDLSHFPLDLRELLEKNYPAKFDFPGRQGAALAEEEIVSVRFQEIVKRLGDEFLIPMALCC